jgi:hypothetical protein
MQEFKIGHRVVYRPANPFKVGGQYVVTRLVPHPNGELRYIIKNMDDPSCEYTALPSELRGVPVGDS